MDPETNKNAKNPTVLWLALIGGLTLALAITVATAVKLRDADVLPPLKTVGKELKAEQEAELAAAPTPIDRAMPLVVAEIVAAGPQGPVKEVVLDADAGPAERGRVLFSKYTCNACHSLDGSRVVGPTLKGLYGSVREFEDGTSATADEAYLHQSILEPKAEIVKGYPPVMVLPAQPTEDEVSDLIAFIKSVHDGYTPPAAQASPTAAAAEPATATPSAEAALPVVAAAAAASSPELQIEAVSDDASAVATEPTAAAPTAAAPSAGAADEALVAAGEAAYKQLTCFACHSIDGTQVVGPSFKGSFGTERKLTDGTTVVMDEAYVRHSILEPMAQIVEGFAPAMVLPVQPTPEQLDALVAFIKSLGVAPAAAEPATPAESAPAAAEPAPAPAPAPEADAAPAAEAPSAASDNATAG